MMPELGAYQQPCLALCRTVAAHLQWLSRCQHRPGRCWQQRHGAACQWRALSASAPPPVAPRNGMSTWYLELLLQCDGVRAVDTGILKPVSTMVVFGVSGAARPICSEEHGPSHEATSQMAAVPAA
eukprot:6213280-Pleurochrysis_carterae.AAC.1